MLALLAQLGILLERNSTMSTHHGGLCAILGRHLQAIVRSQAQWRLSSALPQLPTAPEVVEEAQSPSAPPSRDVVGWLDLLKDQQPTDLENEIMISPDLLTWGGIDPNCVGWPADVTGSVDLGRSLAFWTG